MTCPRITAHWLQGHPLPAPDPAGDKEGRGHVLVVAGSPEMPGATILAATAALRSGAGKLSVVSDKDVAVAIGAAVPEARVESWTNTRSGSPNGRDPLWARRARDACSILIGPGMRDAEAVCRTICRVVAMAELGRRPVEKGSAGERDRAVTVVLDASAISAVKALTHRPAHLLLTPHAGELAQLLGVSKETVSSDPELAAMSAARMSGATVLLKGPTTLLADANSILWRHTSKHAGLGTSGSGDALAGIIAGISAQGAALPLAAAWAVAIHARCAARLEPEHGEVGYLARDLIAEISRSRLDFSHPRAIRAGRRGDEHHR